MKVALSAQILEVKTRPDKTLMLKINTQEPSAEEASQLIKKVMEQLYIVFLDERAVEEEK